MTSYSLAEIAGFINGQLHGEEHLQIDTLSFDSRKLVAPRNSIFFALKTGKNDGHKYIGNAHKKGVQAFVISNEDLAPKNASYILVEDTFLALQQLSKAHRNTFSKPVLALTGSNGKTTVKEWLTSVISIEKKVDSSPRSYNSQIGVPLSLWELDPDHDLAIIEAGISLPGEMEKLQNIITPDLGIFTNIGDAHLSNFNDQNQLISEKIKLFSSCKRVVVCSEHKSIYNALLNANLNTYSWGENTDNDVQIKTALLSGKMEFNIRTSEKSFRVLSSLKDKASIENISHTIAACLLLEVSEKTIVAGISALEPLDMRMQILKGINNCVIINDSYTADEKALENALDLAHQFSHGKSKTLILSELDSSSPSTYSRVSTLLETKNFDRLITIGVSKENVLSIHKNAEYFESTSAFLSNSSNSNFKDEIIVIKGARKYKLERIAKRLQLKDHQTTFELNLNALSRNLDYYKSLIQPSTKIMAMVKAFSYGSGTYEIASHLEHSGVDYLAVAFADEGVELRKNGIQLPILVLNPEPSAFESIIRYNLEPEMYSLSLLKAFRNTLESNNQKNFPVHIKIDSGMHRLGMLEQDISELNRILNQSDCFSVKSTFSHLASSDDADSDVFTEKQIDIFKSISEKIESPNGEKPLQHICNSSAISRFPNAHLDMVRLGIGLYGISSMPEVQKHLELAGTLKTKIIQIRKLKPGDYLGYNRSFQAQSETKIGIIPIGYADGLFRSLGHGKIEVTIGNQKAKIIGTVCMDMSFIDITETQVTEGDEVTIFHTYRDVHNMAEKAQTIPYEVLSAISQRVKRTFYLE